MGFRFKKALHVGQAYGMTETTLSATINPFGKVKPGSVGVVVPGMKAKVKKIFFVLLYYFYKHNKLKH